MKKIKTMKGITLIALVVTIVILIILAGISMNIVLGENGLIKRTKIAKEETRKQSATEILNLKITNVQIETYTKKQRRATLKELAISLNPENDKDVQSMTRESQKVAGLEWINTTDYSSIFIVLKDYPEYEFEINSSLQLASVNGEKLIEEETETVESLKAEINRLKSLLSETDATASDILKDKKAYSMGELVTGTLKNNGSASEIIKAGETYTIPEGYHDGTGTISASEVVSAYGVVGNFGSGNSGWTNKYSNHKYSSNEEYITISGEVDTESLTFTFHKKMNINIIVGSTNRNVCIDKKVKLNNTTIYEIVNANVTINSVPLLNQEVEVGDTITIELGTYNSTDMGMNILSLFIISN